jgi:methyltransferase-like protein
MGSNVLPMAASLPDATFVGMDLGEQHIVLGEQLRQQSGLENARLKHANILDVGPEWGLFDAIVCHGVFSWVPALVQDAILRVLKQNLTPKGIALVSYNVLPGWYDRLPAREFMLRLAGTEGPPRARILKARNALARLAMSVPKDDPQHEVLTRLDRSLTGMSDAYILHEYLSPDNRPEHFSSLIQRAAEHDLHWLGEAAPLWGTALAPEVDALLDVDPIEYECRMDYVRNRMFRSTLLTHTHNPVERRPTWTRLLDGFLVSASFHIRENQLGDEDENCWMDLPDELAAMAQLMVLDHRRLWSIEELAEKGEVPLDTLGPYLLKVFEWGLLELRDRPRRCTAEVQDKPEVCRYARTQATRGEDRLVSRAHLQVEIEDLEQVLIPLMDGTHDQAELQLAVLHIMSRGTYDPDWPGELLVSDQLKENVQELVRVMLRRLADQGLLV